MKMIHWMTGIFTLLILLPACSSAVSTIQQHGAGLIDNRLQPCPSSPNCVCSECTDKSSFVSPVSFSETTESAWAKAITTIQNMGGKIITEESDYLHAVFTSRIFRFVDDLELRLDRENRIIHLRSASRTGYYDFGVNRKRAEQFNTIFASLP